jgi:hypothetical protein
LLQLITLLPPVQNKLRDFSVSAIQKQVNAKVSIGHFHLGFPKKLKVSNILIKKTESDTFLYVSSFSLNLSLLPLLRHQVVLQSIELKDGRGDIGKLLDQIPADSTENKQDLETETVSKPWDVKINKLLVESCYFRYRDETDIGFDLILDIGKAKLHFGSVNLETLIEFKTVEIENSLVSYESLFIPGQVEDTSATSFADIRAMNAHLNESEFAYIDSSGGILFNTRGKDVEVSNLLVDIVEETVSIDDGKAINTTVSVAFLPENDTITTGEENYNWGQSLWRVAGNSMNLEDFKFTLDYLDKPDLPGHFNAEHLHLVDLSGKLEDFRLDEDTMIVKIHNLSGKESNGLGIVQMNGELNQRDSVFTIEKLNIKTDNSNYLIDLETTLSPTNYTEMAGKYYDLNLEMESSNLRDIDYFYPLIDSETIFSDGFTGNGFKLKTEISGTNDELSIRQFDLNYLNSTEIVSKGSIRNFSVPDSLMIELDIEKLKTSKADLNKSLANSIPEPGYKLPDHVFIQGKYSGIGNEHHFAGHIDSEIGRITINKAMARLDSIPSYEISLNTHLQNLKSIVDFGIDQADLKIDGFFSGNDFYTSTGNLQLSIDNLQYYENDFHDIILDAAMDKGQFKSEVKSNDEDAIFAIDMNGEFTKKAINAKLGLDIEMIDLRALHINERDIRCRSKADFGLEYTDMNNFGLNASIQSLDFSFRDTLYNMHPATLTFKTDSSFTDLHLASFYYNLDFTAKDYILDVFSSLTDLPGYYLANPENDSVKFYIPEFNVDGNLVYPEKFAELLFPEFPAFNELKISGSFNKENDELDLNSSLTGVNYGSFSADSMLIAVAGTSGGLIYQAKSGLVVGELLSGKLEISGAFEHSELMTRFRYLDSFSNPYLDLTTRLDTSGNSLIVQFIPDQLIFSYDQWVIDPNNRVEINPEFIAFHDFDLTGDNQRISISSNPEENPQNLELKLIDFSMGSIEQLLALDTVVAGTANAHIRIKNIIESPAFEGSLAIDNLNIYQIDLGKFNLSEFAYSEDQLSFDLDLNSEYGDISADGSWLITDPTEPLDFNLSISHLNISELNYLLSDYISDAKGSLEGNLQVKGNIERPSLNGTMNFTDAGVGVKVLNNYFTLGTESIGIVNNVVQFNDFSITNKQNQSAKIAGAISIPSTSEIYHNIRIITDNMVIMNSTREQNDLIYGLLKAKTDIEIVGPPKEIKVNVDVTIDESTDITYIFPDELALDDNNGIVEYGKFEPDKVIDKDITEHTVLNLIPTLSNFKSRINLNKGTKFKLFFDGTGEDFLKTSLNGQVNYTLVEGNRETSGIFELESGTLHYGLPMVSVEDYEIEPGSSITLSNDIYNPLLNIIASSEVRASTEGLMAGNAKVMTFKVLLLMSGELNDVQLKFDISPETNDAIVSTRLAQLTEEERNINALNLLVRGSFMFNLHGDDLGGTSTMNAQLDKFYASQLNHLIGDNIGFVDLKFDVQSFKDMGSSGDAVTQRNFYYNIGKSFMKDRARINYKGSLGITSDLQAEQVNSHFVQNELEFEVKITKNGDFRAVFFRKNEYEGLLEGEIIETGGGLRFSKEFYSIGDIFTNDNRHKKKN